MTSILALDAVQREAGARLGLVGEVEVVRHYGDPAAEYQSIRTRAAAVLRSDLTQLRLWGRDPERMLNGLITNDLGLLAEDRAVHGAILSPKGRMIAEVRVVRRGDELLVAIPTAALDAVSDHLKRYVPPLFARWESLAGSSEAIGVYGPDAAAVVKRALGVELPGTEDGVVRANFEGAEVIVIGTAFAGGEPGADLVAPTGVTEALWRALTAGGEPAALPAGMAALETARIEQGRPRYGAEMTEKTLVGEAYEAIGGMERSVSFNKGCYTGQEVVVRIAHRGHVNRHLRGLLLGDTPAPAPETPLESEETGKTVGWITSSANSPRLEQTIALAMVRREMAPGSTVRIGDSGDRATVVELPFSV